MNSELTEAQLLVHQKIGRNLLRIQHLERMLKFLTAIKEGLTLAGAFFPLAVVVVDGVRIASLATFARLPPFT